MDDNRLCRISSTETNEKVKQLFDPKSSGSEESYQTDEESNSEQSISGSLTSFNNISAKNKHSAQNMKKNSPKSQFCRLTVSLRYGKFNRRFKTKNKSRKISKKEKCNKFPEKNKTNLDKSTEVPKKGKRCRLGGKAKGKPPQEEGRDKRDSDDDSDNFYFGRISLGYFQKFKDKSGASTSCQWEENYKSIIPLGNAEQIIHNNPSEEMELLELQKWGKTALVPSYDMRSADFDENVKLDRF